MKYKRLVSIFLTVLMAFIAFTGCTQNDSAPPVETAAPTLEPTVEPTTEPTIEPVPETTQALDETAQNGLSSGLGIYTDISKSVAAEPGSNGRASATSIAAYVLTDTDGLIVKCDFDSAQTSVPIDSNGQLVMDSLSELQSKMQAGESYGMAAASPISREWNEQAKSFSEWCVGKSIGEVKGMSVRKSDSGGIYPDVPELATSVTIDIGGFLSSIYSASSALVDTGMQSAPAKTGLGATSTVNSKSVGASVDANGLFQVDTTVAAVSIDEFGKILSCSFDAVQPKINFDQTGETVLDLEAPVLSKHALKDDYGMAKFSPIGKEWYQQADSFAEWAVGKTIDEMRSFGIKDNGGGIEIDDPELASSVTITVGDFMVALEKAVENAK